MKDVPLALDGWVQFNCDKWGLRPLHLGTQASAGVPATLEALLYVDGRGRIVQPRLTPYLPIAFQPRALKGHRVHREWLDAVAPVIEEMTRRGLRSAVNLPPEIHDARPWQWAGYPVRVGYTFRLTFPFAPQEIASSLRRHLNQARRSEYVCRETDDMGALFACMQETELRQGFSHGLTLADLQRAATMVGHEHLRVYACYAPSGEVVSAASVLVCPGAVAVGWVMGTRSAYLPHGVSSLVLEHVILEAERLGATGLDFTGGNLPSVSEAKAQWGAALQPMFKVEGYGLRTLGKWLIDWSRFPRSEPRPAAKRSPAPEAVPS